MKCNWTLMCDLMRTDLITMKGGRNSSTWIIIVFVLFMGVMGFIVSPLAGLYVPFLMGAFFVPMLFNNEMKYHSEKLWSLLPIERKDLVNTRFLLSIGLFAAAGLLYYLLMLAALRLKLWYLLNGADAMPDIIGMIADKQGFTEIGFFNLCYFGAFAFGLYCMSSSLRKYFRDPEAFNALMQLGNRKKATRKEWMMAALILGALLLWGLIVTGILPVGPAVSVLLALFGQLSRAANGFILGAVFLTMGAFKTLYEYVCTLIEYDSREL